MTPIHSIASHIGQTKSATEYAFDRIVIPANSTLPKNLDLSGSFAITRDRNHKGLVHILIYILQKINNFIFGRKANCDLAHGMIILGHDQKPLKKGNIIVAHSVLDGIHTSSYNFKADKYITEMIVYIPKDKNLRQLLTQYGNQTAYNPKDKNGSKKTPKFSFTDVFSSVVYNRRYKKGAKRSKRVIERVSKVVADLLLGNQILDKKNRVKPLFCTAYATTILQGATLINSLSPQDISALKKSSTGPNRRIKLAQNIFNRIHQKNSNDPLSKTYWENRIFRWNTRFLMSATAGATLDRISKPYRPEKYQTAKPNHS